MKLINFILPSATIDGYSTLVECVYSGFKYDQTRDYLSDIGYYLPEDQFNTFNELQHQMLDLDIGNRQGEWKSER